MSDESRKVTENSWAPKPAEAAASGATTAAASTKIPFSKLRLAANCRVVDPTLAKPGATVGIVGNPFPKR